MSNTTNIAPVVSPDILKTISASKQKKKFKPEKLLILLFKQLYINLIQFKLLKINIIVLYLMLILHMRLHYLPLMFKDKN